MRMEGLELFLYEVTSVTGAIITRVPRSRACVVQITPFRATPELRPVTKYMACGSELKERWGTTDGRTGLAVTLRIFHISIHHLYHPAVCSVLVLSDRFSSIGLLNRDLSGK